jgi:hypothetical protein
MSDERFSFDIPRLPPLVIRDGPRCDICALKASAPAVGRRPESTGKSPP